MTIVLSPGATTLDTLERIYRSDSSFELDSEAFSAIEAGAAALADGIKSKNAIYGVNTGFGKLASVRISDDKLEELQRNLVRSHCAGYGDPLPLKIVRLMIALKCLSLGRGASGVRPDLVKALLGLIKANVMPVIPTKGSVGASGDLAPLAHLSATLIGEGEAIFKGEKMASAKALQQAGLKPIALQAKEGLALLNGTQASTALALGGIFDAWRLAVASLTTAALSVDAAMASAAPFRDEIQQLRGHQGQIESARRLRALLDGSEIRDSHRNGDDRVQDPYCLRCVPQVVGACLDQLRHAGRTLQVEANAATDNPLILSDGQIISGGNFHAEPVGIVADLAAIAISEIGCIAQRRVALLVDPTLSFGLPAFLAPDPGLTSGLMIAEVTAAALMSENKSLSNPRSVDSTPTSADQEDHVSMACHGARRLHEMNENLAGILGIEAMAATQGVELRTPLKTSARLQSVSKRIRKVCAPLDKDRIVAPEIEALAAFVLNERDLDAFDGIDPVEIWA